MKKKLKDICTQIRGISYKPADVRDEFSGIPVLRANNIQDAGIVLDELVKSRFIEMKIMPHGFDFANAKSVLREVA